MTQNISCQGKNREFGNFAKTQGILFARVVNSLIQKVKDISIFAVKISMFSKSQVSFVYVTVKKSHKLAQGKFAIGQKTGKTQGI